MKSPRLRSNSFKSWVSRMDEKRRKGLQTLKYKTRGAFGKLRNVRMPWNTRFPRARMNVNLPNGPGPNGPRFYKNNESKKNNNTKPLLNNNEKPASLSRQRATNAPEFNYENLRKLREEPEPKPYKTRNSTRRGRKHKNEINVWANRKNAAVSTNANNFFGTAPVAVNFGNAKNSTKIPKLAPPPGNWKRVSKTEVIANKFANISNSSSNRAAELAALFNKASAARANNRSKSNGATPSAKRNFMNEWMAEPTHPRPSQTK